MKAAMIFPAVESERAISGYSSTLTNTMKKVGVNIQEVKYFAGKPFSLRKILGELKDYNVIHIQHEYNLLGGFGIPFFFLLTFLKFFTKAKVVVTMHTVLSQSEEFKGGKLKTFLRKLLYKIQNRWINWNSDKVVVHADFFKQILLKEYGFKKDKITIFPQGIIEEVKTLSKAQAKKKFKLSGPVYLFMGGMVPDHGHDIIIKQADKIGKTVLVVANPGSVNDRNSDRTRQYLEENKKFVDKNKLNKYVRFDVFDITDKKPEWWEYFSAADFIMLSYRGGIGSGIFAHAMAIKKPVIASNIQYFNEIAKNYGCIKVAKNDKDYVKVIKEAIKPENYKKMVQECERYFKENGLTPVAKRYKKLYGSLK
jgi:glycosyltransferase involved in cell wall biosynthesis